jgi:hypothetical protein
MKSLDEARFSFRVVIACLCFSLSSMLLMSFGYGVYSWFKPLTTPFERTRVLAFLFGGGLLFFVGTRKRGDNHYDVFLSSAVALVLGGTTAFIAGTSGHTLGFYVGLTAGVGCNYTVLTFARRLTIFGTNTSHGVAFVALALITAIVGLGLLVAPMLAMNTGRFGGLVADLLGFGAISNLFSGTIAASFVPVALLLCLPKATWSLLSRPLYALARFRVLQNRKRLFFAGSTLIVIGVPALSELSARIVSFFT